MGLFKSNPKTEPRIPSEEEVHAAGRQLQQGGRRGRGCSKAADRLVKEAGPEHEQVTAMRILAAAAEYEPRD